MEKQTGYIEKLIKSISADALVTDMESCDFNFGFNEGMQSSFSEFKEMEYKYTLKITPEAAAPATEPVQ